MIPCSWEQAVVACYHCRMGKSWNHHCVGSLTIERFSLLGAGVTLFVSFLIASSLKLFIIVKYLNIDLLKPMVELDAYLLV